MVSKTLVGMSITNIHLLQFKIQSQLWKVTAQKPFNVKPVKNNSKLWTNTLKCIAHYPYSFSKANSAKQSTRDRMISIDKIINKRFRGKKSPFLKLIGFSFSARKK